MNNKNYDIYNILGLVFGIISLANINLIFSILGIIFSNIAKKEDNTSKLAKVGFTLSIISLVMFICFAIILAILLILRFLPFNLN